ncbi:MAG: DNA polymerase III subunit gamma/tau [Clostridia bacterium]|nr:DNA polymerase III subunit gamma/tau [Clostridia bacterium]
MKQALYRKYRPADFSQVAGQQQVTVTLRNEVAGGNISHAYLFTGVRGTGKTSCARILAKAVNCLSPKDGNPCNECEICRAIDSGTLTDVIEIDAASNTGVDNIRALREEISYLPQRAKYKIYIIDEVHMLSAGAFNALLKTLEEPPEHAVFILATTEVHKLPATILSRCQRFNFRRIDAEALAAYLSHIAQAEGFAVTDDALRMLAAAADGGMRDAISLLDVCRAASDTVDASVVARAVGLSGSERVLELCGLIADGDISGCLSALAALYADSKEPERLCEELLAALRNVLIMKTADNAASLINTDPAGLESIKRVAKRFTLGRIMSSVAAVNDAIARMRFAFDKKTEAEMLLVSLCVASGAVCAEPAQPAVQPKPETKPEQKIAPPVILSEAKDPTPSADVPQDEADSSREILGITETQPSAEDSNTSSAPSGHLPLEGKAPEPAPEPVPEPASSGAAGMLAAALPEIRKASPMLGAVLSGSRCNAEGDVFTIHSSADCVVSNTKLISDALFSASGIRYNVVTDAEEPPFSKIDELDERLKQLFD